MKNKIAVAVASLCVFCVPFLSSCSLQDIVLQFTKKVIDKSQLIIGGYPRAVLDPKSESTDTTKKDYYIYLRYGAPKSDTDREYDIAIDLNNYASNPAFTKTANALGDLPSYYNVDNNGVELTLEDYFSAKNVISLFTSVGTYDKSSAVNFCSENYTISESGKAFCFNTISEDGEALIPSFSTIYKQTFIWEEGK